MQTNSINYLKHFEANRKLGYVDENIYKAEIKFTEEECFNYLIQSYRKVIELEFKNADCKENLRTIYSYSLMAAQIIFFNFNSLLNMPFYVPRINALHFWASLISQLQLEAETNLFPTQYDNIKYFCQNAKAKSLPETGSGSDTAYRTSYQNIGADNLVTVYAISPQSAITSSATFYVADSSSSSLTSNSSTTTVSVTTPTLKPRTSLNANDLTTTKVQGVGLAKYLANKGYATWIRTTLRSINNVTAAYQQIEQMVSLYCTKHLVIKKNMLPELNAYYALCTSLLGNTQFDYSPTNPLHSFLLKFLEDLNCIERKEMIFGEKELPLLSAFFQVKSQEYQKLKPAKKQDDKKSETKKAKVGNDEDKKLEDKKIQNTNLVITPAEKKDEQTNNKKPEKKVPSKKERKKLAAQHQLLIDQLAQGDQISQLRSAAVTSNSGSKDKKISVTAAEQKIDTAAEETDYATKQKELRKKQKEDNANKSLKSQQKKRHKRNKKRNKTANPATKANLPDEKPKSANTAQSSSLEFSPQVAQINTGINSERFNTSSSSWSNPEVAVKSPSTVAPIPATRVAQTTTATTLILPTVSSQPQQMQQLLTQPQIHTHQQIPTQEQTRLFAEQQQKKLREQAQDTTILPKPKLETELKQLDLQQQNFRAAIQPPSPILATNPFSFFSSGSVPVAPPLSQTASTQTSSQSDIKKVTSVTSPKISESTLSTVVSTGYNAAAAEATNLDGLARLLQRLAFNPNHFSTSIADNDSDSDRDHCMLKPW